MKDKRARERAAIDRLIHHYWAMGRGEWTWEKGDDPPDFIIVRAETGEHVGVEHTSFIWPTNEVGWDHAVKQMMDDVRTAVRDKIQGVLVLEIDQAGIHSFQRDYTVMSKRRRISKWLADEILAVSDRLDVGKRKVIRGPLLATITRDSWTTGGSVGLVRSISKGNDLGFRLVADLSSERLIVERIDKPDTALSCYEEILKRKATRLEDCTVGPKVLFVDDYSMWIDNLLILAKTMDVPSDIDELYIWAARDDILVGFAPLWECPVR